MFAVSEWITSMENKLKPFLEVSSKISEEEALKLGMKNPEKYPWPQIFCEVVKSHFSCR